MATKRSAVTSKVKPKKVPVSRNSKKPQSGSRLWLYCILSFWLGLLVAGVAMSLFHPRSPISLLSDSEKKSTDIRFLLGLASDVFKNGDYDKAAALYRRVLQIDPNNFDANLYLATVMAEKSDPPDIGSAIYHSGKALEIKKDYRALIAYGGLYWKIGEYAKAEEIFRVCAKENPQDFNAWWELGYMLEKQNKFMEALAAYQKAEVLCRDQAAKSQIDEAIKAMSAKRSGA